MIERDALTARLSAVISWVSERDRLMALELDSIVHQIEQLSSVPIPKLIVKRYVLYRLYSLSRNLVYVGITGDPIQRLRTHAATKAWWPDITGVRLQLYPDRFSLVLAEKMAIRDEKPQQNQRSFRMQSKTIRLSVTEIANVQAVADRENLDWSEAARQLIDRGLAVILSEPMEQHQ